MTAILEPLECPTADVASVPRRFGVGVLLILMTAFSVLFAIMRTFGAPPEVFIVVAGLFVAVTLGQILLFQGKKPREASLLAGAVVVPVGILAVCFYSEPWQIGGGEFCGLFCCAIAGAPLGYLAGCIMAGVFFVQERYRHRRQPPEKIELLPFTANDFDTLISWVHHAPLFNLWSRGRFRYPLDHSQLAAHLELTSGESPSYLCFKAVCGEMQQMVAYAELANIDRNKFRASIELAIVDPSRNDRDHLSEALAWEIMQQAFNQQGLQWLGVRLRRSEVQSLECFRKQGFHDTWEARPGDGPEEYVKLIRSSRY